MNPITWRSGTAYDLFISLYVVHHPDVFGLRLSWAAGVRSRLPAPQRSFLERCSAFLPVPLAWLNRLPAENCTASAALEALAALSPAERHDMLMFNADTPAALKAAAQATLDGHPLSDELLEGVRTALLRRDIQLRPALLADLKQAWSDPATFGEQYLLAVQTYYSVFFAEEEARIEPHLARGLQQAQALADRLPVPELLAELSHGVHFELLTADTHLVLAPSFWGSPLVFYAKLDAGARLVLFGCRDSNQHLVPGDSLPEGMLNAFKALGDPTRLRILRYLSQKPHTPSELSKRLRLRPPTVIHHLSELRVAGLVEITVDAEHERRYAIRRAALEGAFVQLTEFLDAAE